MKLPALNLKTGEAGAAAEPRWTAAPSARAYVAAGMAAGGKAEMVLWTSSALPDTGLGLTGCEIAVAIGRVRRGSNNEGQLGTGDLILRTTPTAVLGGGTLGGP